MPAMALQFAMVAMGAALRGTGNFKPGHGRADRHGHHQHGARADPDLRLGHRFRRWASAGAARGDVHRDRRRRGVDLVSTSSTRTPTCAFMPRHWKPRASACGADMLKIGLPAGAEFALMASTWPSSTAITEPFGAAAQAGFGIGLRIVQSAFLPVVALGFAVAPVAGQNFGARQGRSRARRRSRRRRRWRRSACCVFALLAHLSSPRGADRHLHRRPGGDRRRRRVPAHRRRGTSSPRASSSCRRACSRRMGNTHAVAGRRRSLRIVVVAIPAFFLSRVPGFELRWIWYLTRRRGRCCR